MKKWGISVCADLGRRYRGVFMVSYFILLQRWLDWKVVRLLDEKIVIIILVDVCSLHNLDTGSSIMDRLLSYWRFFAKVSEVKWLWLWQLYVCSVIDLIIFISVNIGFLPFQPGSLSLSHSFGWFISRSTKNLHITSNTVSPDINDIVFYV